MFRKRGVTLLLLTAGLLSAVGSYAQKKPVDYRSEFGNAVKIGDSQVLKLWTEVYLHHNGTIIACDSAYKYSANHFECMGHVLINNGDVNIYGDRVDYNGVTNIARVYSPMVKMTDKEMTLYTRQMEFNTLTKIGHCYDGVTVSNKEDVMESNSLYYYTDNRELLFLNRVSMKSPDYEFRNDSLRYNLNTETARFLNLTYIWDKEDNFLTARRGSYVKPSEFYSFFNGYILTQTQELWADSLTYSSGAKESELWGNVQVTDHEQKAMCFGEYGHYWGEPENVLVAERPSVLSYEEVDTVYYSSRDSLWLLTIEEVADSTDAGTRSDSLRQSPPEGRSMVIAPGSEGEGALTEAGEEEGSARQEEEFVTGDQARPTDSLPPAPRNILPPDYFVRQVLRAVNPDSIALARKERREALAAEQARVADSLALIATGADSLLSTLDSTLIARADSMLTEQTDSLEQALDKDALLSRTGSNTETADSTSKPKQIKGYFDVKVYRSDFQAVCDSLAGHTRDSLITMYKDPVMWNGNTQISSERMDIYVKNRRVDKAFFVGTPFIGQRLESDTSRYNQLAGREMEAYFKDGEMDRLDTKGNAATLYYMEENGEATSLADVKCVSIVMYFKQREIDDIRFYGPGEYVIDPIDQIPASQTLLMQGFKWQGDRRPTLKQVFDRAIRPSQQETSRIIPRSDFPVTLSIQNAIRILKENGWQDRTDTITISLDRIIHNDITLPGMRGTNEATTGTPGTGGTTPNTQATPATSTGTK